MITTELRKINFPQSSINHMKEIMELRDIDQTTSEYLNSVIGEQKDIKQLVKKL